MSDLSKRLAEIFDVDVSRINPDAEFSKSDFWDSLTQVRVLTFLVEEFDVSLTEENFERYKKMQNILSDFE